MIKTLRLRLGISQQKFADAIGITQEYLSLIEKGKRPLRQSLSNLIYKKFNISIKKQIQTLESELTMLKMLR